MKAKFENTFSQMHASYSTGTKTHICLHLILTKMDESVKTFNIPDITLFAK